MAHRISVSPDKAYILVTVTGEITARSAMEQNREAHALGERLGIDCYLVDVTDARNVDSTVDNYNFAYRDMQAPPINPRARVALLVRPGDHSHDFVETVSRNAGLDVTIFTNLSEARKFLGS